MTKITVQLDSLIGEHLLEGVDFCSEQIKKWSDELEDASAVRFRLDGLTFTAVEDPDDGYRSCLGQLYVSGDKLQNMFEGVKVIGVKKPGNDADIIWLIDAKTGNVVLEVGTDNSDDYYPLFVAVFHPENMVINK